jgi:magnesium-transporting ATPase (P-type)
MEESPPDLPAVQTPEYRKEINMLKLALVILGLIIFAVLFSLGNVSGTAGNLVKLLFTALAAIFIMVLATIIVPKFGDRGR